MQPFSENRLHAITLVVGIAIYAALLAAGLPLTDGVLVYPLDDTYIHLSMAEQIARGGYGINPGEYASADSSILYPLLLTPFAGTAFHPYLPLVLNFGALVFALVLMVKILVEAGLVALPHQKRFVIFLGVALPVAFNFQGLALLGMEHMLHVVTVLMALLGLMRWLNTGSLNGMLIAGILLGPLLRYEGLGLSLSLSMVLVFLGHKKLGASLALAVISAIIGFGFWLQSLGLSFFPNSVMAKSSFEGTGIGKIWAQLTFNFGQLGSPIYATLFILAGVILLLLAIWPRFRMDRNVRVIAFVAGAMTLGHAALGKFGWANRYEIYALSYLCLSVIVIISPFLEVEGRRSRTVKFAAFCGSMFAMSHYIGFLVVWSINGPGNIYNQQWQMSEMLRAYEGGAVMVNDIGLVSYQDETRIIDIFGLASMAALEARRNRAPRGWLNQMAVDENAGMAMMYDNWFARDLNPGWVAVAYLDTIMPSTFISPRVTIYATSPELVAPVQALVTGYAPKLSRHATLTLIGTDAEPPAKEGQ